MKNQKTVMHGLYFLSSRTFDHKLIKNMILRVLDTEDLSSSTVLQDPLLYAYEHEISNKRENELKCTQA